MPKLVKQSVILPAPARELYAMYLNARKHGAITGRSVKIGARPGSKFRAFNGALSGQTLQTVPGRLIVQAWRSTAFHKNDPDSTLVPAAGDGDSRVSRGGAHAAPRGCALPRVWQQDADPQGRLRLLHRLRLYRGMRLS